ncbi:hypothetical protein PG985_014186 [Apiospora marii]|uniref:uncharacterized protein n=1 Tax=Apiospora marii TaxID=335849 RepID=UPI00312F9B5E
MQDLQRGRPDKIPVRKLKSATDEALFRKKVSPGSAKCDDLLFEYLAPLKGELFAHQVGIIACVHAFSYDKAKDVIVSVRPNYRCAGGDEHFDRKLSAYLGTLMACREAHKLIVSERVYCAAVSLLRIMKILDGRFPSLKHLLRPIGEDVLEEFLPARLIQTVLERQRYRTGLEDELEVLCGEQRWVEIQRLVGFLRTLHERQSGLDIIPQMIPKHQMWKAWNPNLQRIQLWDDRLKSPQQRIQLKQFLALEGPDMSGQCFATAKQDPNMNQVLEEALDLLDLAISSGDLAVDLFIYFIVQHGPLEANRLAQVRLCLAAGHDERTRDNAAGKLVEFHRYIARPLRPSRLLGAFVSVHEVLTRAPELRAKLGIDKIEFANFISEALTSLQIDLCNQIQHNNIHSITRVGTRICAFVSAFRKSVWLCEYWSPGYMAKIQQSPTEFEMQSLIGKFERATGESKLWYMDEIADRIGFSPRPGHNSTSPSEGLQPHTTPIQVLEEDSLWGPRRKLDIDRERLRAQVLGSLRTTAPELATSCLKQCMNEPDTFISELLLHLPPSRSPLDGISNSDTICVNLASFLGPRDAAANSSVINGGRSMVHEIWKSLLMHMMRALPPGLMERCAATLARDECKAWLRNLRQLYGDNRYLDPEGGLGITKEKIRAWDVQTRGASRSQSTRAPQPLRTSHGSMHTSRTT